MIESIDFDNGGLIPLEESCIKKKFGKNKNPQLSWNIQKQGIKSFVLIMEDLDAIKVIGKPYIHWFIPYISSNITSLPSKINQGSSTAIISKNDKGETIMIEGENSNGNFGYIGPCPPKGQKHRYDYHLYGIDIIITPKKSVYTTEEFEKELYNNIISHNRIFGYYIDTYKN
jgi:Raf kinase inhibitor-like YbhB/YbcL family protein